MLQYSSYVFYDSVNYFPNMNWLRQEKHLPFLYEVISEVNKIQNFTIETVNGIERVHTHTHTHTHTQREREREREREGERE